MGGSFSRYGDIVYMDIFGQSSRKTTPSGLIQGKQGTGKSTLSKKMTMQYVKRGTKAVVIDPHGEWQDIAKLHGHPVYEIGKIAYNPFELDGMPLSLKISTSAEILDEIKRNQATKAQHVAFRQSLKRAYEKHGHVIGRKSRSRKYPTFKDVYKDSVKCSKKFTAPKNWPYEINSLDLEEYAVGAYSKALTGKTTRINWNAPLVVFDLSRVDPILRKMVTLSIMGKIYQKMKSDLSPLIFLIDEGFRMLENPSVARYVGEFMKEGRKYNTALVLVIHHLGDLNKISSDISDEIKRGMGWHAVFHLDESARKQTARELGLTETHERFIKDAETGEFLLMSDSESRFCKVVLTGSRDHFDINTEYWQFTTDPIDVEIRNQKLGKKKIKLPKEPVLQQEEPEEPNYQNFKDLKKLIKPGKGLTDRNKKRLESKDFRTVRIHQMIGHGTEIYYVDRSIKNGAHDAGVFQIAAYVQTKLKLPEKEVKIHYNYGCDLEFKRSRRKVFVEYANSKASTSDLARKLQFEKEVGPKNYFIVVSDKKLKKRYQGFKNVLLRKELEGLTSRRIFIGFYETP